MARRRNFKRQEPTHNFRINDKIRIPEVRLVGDNLEAVAEEIGVTIEPGEVHKTKTVLSWADQVGLDLVEISPNAKPPVVKIIDFKKFLYERKKKEKELKAKTSKTVIKEIRFGPNTDDHDYQFKLKHAKNFLSDGAKVKAFVLFRGRTIVFKDRGELLLLRFLKDLEEVGTPETLPRLEGRRMTTMVVPKKK